jgi:ligand-binding sensor domain-containing protein/signal transduction histidine kinase/CheY-like chemotaxis protein/AraC-like DNA-binding protein
MTWPTHLPAKPRQWFRTTTKFWPVLMALVWTQMELTAQSQITFRQLSVKEGLSQNSAISISQDSTGYLWIATQDGLNRYDGNTFKVFPFNFMDVTKPDYSHLGKVYTDRRGRVWIIPMDNVLRQWNANTQTFKPFAPNLEASTIYQDTSMRLWIGTYNGELFVVPKGQAVPEMVWKSKETKTIFTITEDTHGNLLVATEGRLMTVNYADSKVQMIYPKDAKGQNIKANFSSFALGPNGRQWTGTFGQGLFYKEGSSEIYERAAALSLAGHLPDTLNIIALLQDAKDRLWVATYGNGLYLIDVAQGRIQHFTPSKYDPKTLHYNDVISLYEDYTGTLWFGTDGAGLSFHDESLEKFNSLTNLQTPEGINIDVARAITKDGKNRIWIGTSGKGLTSYDPSMDQWTSYRQDDGYGGLSSNRIMSLLWEPQGYLWIGTQGGGLNIMDSIGNVRRFSQNSKIPLRAETIWCIFQDTGERIWLGTREQGLILFDRTKGMLRQYKKGMGKLNSNNIRVIAQAGERELWLGTEDSALFHFDMATETFTPYVDGSTKNTVFDNSIKSLHYAPDDILWIGTNGGGLKALDTKKGVFHRFTMADGLPNNVIYGILPDEDGSLWLSSNKGITKFTPTECGLLPKITNYNNYAGLATEFNTGAYFKDGAGILFFGGLDGLYWFDPQKIQTNQIFPKTTITGFEVSNSPHSISKDIRLSHDQNTLTFTFSSLHFSLPEKNGYQYRLLYHEKEWVDGGNTPFARYAQLPPGQYTFQVKSSNYDGVWNQDPSELSFIISPPWFRSPLAHGVYAIALVLGVFGIYRYLKWRWRMQLNLKLNREEAGRLQRLNEFKSKLYTNIAHEFKTPLTLIAGPIDQSLAQGQLLGQDHANLSIVKRNTHRLTTLVDQLLELAKLEEGRLQLKMVREDLGLFLTTIIRSFEYAAQEKGIQLTMEVGSMKDVWFDADIMEKVLSNLLNNAVKYTPKGGACSVSITMVGHYAQMHIKNSVSAPNKIDLSKMFTRFYQEDEQAEGVGVGLSLVHELTKFYGGSVKVALTDDQWILFEVRLPIDPIVFPEKAKWAAQEVSKQDHQGDPFLAHEAIYKESPTELPLLLIAEDHDEVRDFIAGALRKTYHIIEACNGKIAQELALSKIPDIILSDVRMPIQNGIALCNALKSDERTSHIPIVLLTASNGEEAELDGLTSGADDFVTKPFKISILAQRLANLIAVRRNLRQRYGKELILRPKDIAITPTDQVFLQKIQQILDVHLSDPQFNAASFSKYSNLSRMQLHRKLQAYTGLSTTAFIRSQRLKQATDLLSSTDLTINEIAYAVGFSTPSYFMKCFKEQFKTTPTKFMATKAG